MCVFVVSKSESLSLNLKYKLASFESKPDRNACKLIFTLNSNAILVLRIKGKKCLLMNNNGSVTS